MPSSSSIRRTEGASTASDISQYAARRCDALVGELPSTKTSECMSSIPAEALATAERYSSVGVQSAAIASSSWPAGTSPVASATPSADAPRERPIEW